MQAIDEIDINAPVPKGDIEYQLLLAQKLHAVLTFYEEFIDTDHHLLMHEVRAVGNMLYNIFRFESREKVALSDNLKKILWDRIFQARLIVQAIETIPEVMVNDER